MKTASEILEEVKHLFLPNKGVKALADRAYNDDEGFCIMDDEEYGESYRCECLDRSYCGNPEFMLACLQTRWNNQLGKIAVEIYNKN